MHDPRLAFSSGVRRPRARPYNDHPAPRAGLASPCLPSGPCRTDRHAPAISPQCIPESSCAASARCSSRATHAWAWPVCWRSPSARRRCSPAPSLGGALGPLLARLLHCADSDIEAGLYGYNAVLIGMLLAFRFAWSPGLVSLVALGCLASVALQRLFLHGLRRRRWLPPYTLGFVLNGWWLVPSAPGWAWPRRPMAAASAAPGAARRSWRR